MMMDGAVGKILFSRRCYYISMLLGGASPSSSRSMAPPPQLQLQQEQPQLVPHLQVLQSQPPASAAASNPPELLHPHAVMVQ